jgi:GxxExxY protein
MTGRLQLRVFVWSDDCSAHVTMLTNPDDINALTHDIIGSAIRVHQVFGSGLLESANATCLEIELRRRGHSVRRNVPVHLVYEGVRVENAYWIDMIVDDRVVVELKCVEKLAHVHRAQLLTYLRLANKPVGLLINFNEAVLKDGIRRVINPDCLGDKCPTS